MCSWTRNRCDECDNDANNQTLLSLVEKCDEGVYHEPDAEGEVTDGMEVVYNDINCGRHSDEPELSIGESESD